MLVESFISSLFINVHGYLMKHKELLDTEDGNFLHRVAIVCYAYFIDEKHDADVKMVDMICDATANITNASKPNAREEYQGLVDCLMSFCKSFKDRIKHQEMEKLKNSLDDGNV